MCPSRKVCLLSGLYSFLDKSLGFRQVTPSWLLLPLPHHSVPTSPPVFGLAPGKFKVTPHTVTSPPRHLPEGVPTCARPTSYLLWETEDPLKP